MSIIIAQSLQKVIAHHQAQQLSDAERIYRSIIQTDPKHPDANHNLGVLMVQTNQLTAAFSYFKTAVATNPNEKQYWFSYIDALIQDHQIEVARKVLEQAQQNDLGKEVIAKLLNRINFAHWMSLAQTAHKLQDHETSLSYFQKALALVPEHPTLPIKIAAELRELGRLEEAATILQELLNRQPNSFQGCSCLAVIFREQQNHEKALIYFQKALKLQPEHQTLPIEITTELRELGRFYEAQQILWKRFPTDKMSTLKIQKGFIEYDSMKNTVLIVSHEASRTGAPILCFNLAQNLQKKYNIILFFS